MEEMSWEMYQLCRVAMVGYDVGSMTDEEIAIVFTVVDAREQAECAAILESRNQREGQRRDLPMSSEPDPTCDLAVAPSPRCAECGQPLRDDRLPLARQ